jgi:hypothetical protein
MTDKIVNVTGDAVPKSRRRGATRRNRKQDGGDNSGALMQLAAQRPTPEGSLDRNAQTLAQQAAAQVKAIMPNFGSAQRGGDNSGGLLQLATIPQMGGPMNTQQFQTEFRAQVQTALENNFGPDKAQQFGGKGRRGQQGGDVTAGAIQLSASNGPKTPDAPEVKPVVSGIDPSQPAPVGGARLVLAPPKRKTRIALKAKKYKGGSDSSVNQEDKIFGGATKKARKIHLRTKGVTSRLAKAKKAKKMAMTAPISTVRSKLESAGVIKKGSKAPDAMLRTMYADLLITKKGL